MKIGSRFVVAAIGLLTSSAAQTTHAQTGRAVFHQVCAACHEGGISGAPALRDKAAWKARLKKGNDALVQSALQGLGGMPARGGNGSLTDAEVRAAVLFMLTRVRQP
jgi:cytochrome c5